MNPDQSSSISRGVGRRSMLIGVCVLAAAGCDQSKDKKTIATANDSGETRSLEPPKATSKIVTMLGDSITAGYGLAAADALPAQLELALRAMGLNVRVRAAGVSGDTSAGGLARVDFSVQDDTDLCIVALGGNDLLQGIEPSTLRANLQAIVKKLKARSIPVLLAGMRAPPQYGTYSVDFDQVFPALAKAENIDEYPFLLNGVALDQRYNQSDGIHPNADGVKIIVGGLAPVVAKALAAS